MITEKSNQASHYFAETIGSQPAIATADMFDKLRPYLPEVPEYVERLVCERTGLEWTAYKQRPVVGQKDSGLDKASGNTVYMSGCKIRNENGLINITAPATEAARQWQGWGTALKPALEPITVARKPLVGTVAENVLTHGTGALNIDGCRVATDDKLGGGHCTVGQQMSGGWERPWMNDADAVAANAERSRAAVAKAEQLGRWPANLIHDGNEEVTSLLGDASRFFYCAKASGRDRDEGVAGVAGVAGVGALRDNGRASLPRKNHHPTVKPAELMRYLCRLVTPPSGVVLDPFTGSGSTGKAAILERFNFIGIEREAEYCEIARARITEAEREIMGQLNLE